MEINNNVGVISTPGPGAELKSDVVWQLWHSSVGRRANGAVTVREALIESEVERLIQSSTLSSVLIASLKFDVQQGSIFQEKEWAVFIYETYFSSLPFVLLLFLSFILPSSAPRVTSFSLSVSSGLWFCCTLPHCRVFWANDCPSSPPPPIVLFVSSADLPTQCALWDLASVMCSV